MSDASDRHIGPRPESQDEASATIQRWRALLIGVRDYEDPSFSPVRYAVQDVTALAEVLRAGGYESVQELHSDQPPDMQPTIKNIADALDTLVQGADGHTLLLVYFAGHGITEGEGAYLLPCGRVGGNCRRFALSVGEMETRLRDSGARAAALVMDACHAGARLGVRAAADPEFVRRVIEQALGLVIISASDQRGVAYEDDKFGHGVFTYYLLEALRGAAHHERGPYVTASRVYEHVANQVAAWGEHTCKLQHPTWIPGVYGDPPLACPPEPPRVNPFIVGPAIRDPARFYGRQSELWAIAGRVGGISAGSISIVGERRIGKSSLLWQVKNQAETLFHTGHRYVVVYLDLSSASGASNRLLMRTLRRELTRAGLPAWEVSDDGDLAAFNYTLEDLEATIQDVRLVLCLDEFEYINDHPQEFDGLLGELRAEAQLGRLALVTASRMPLADLCAQGRIRISPFFNIFTQVELGPLGDVSWRSLVQDGLDEVSDDDWHFIEQCARRHPFLTQMAAALLWGARQADTMDYTALRAEFDKQVTPHWAYWDRHKRGERMNGGEFDVQG